MRSVPQATSVYAPAPIEVGDLVTMVSVELRRAQIATTRRFNELMGRAGVAPGQYSALRLIAANPGRTQSALADMLHLDRSTLVPIIDRLEESGYVRRVPSPADRRAYSIEATAEGEALLATLEPSVARLHDEIGRGLDAAERETLVSLLRRVTCSLEGPEH